jgi:hypothetical protein
MAAADAGPASWLRAQPTPSYQKRCWIEPLGADQKTSIDVGMRERAAMPVPTAALPGAAISPPAHSCPLYQ